MVQLEKMSQLKNNDIQEFEKFSDLVGIIVVKLKAEGRNGELGKGKSHSLLVKKLAEASVPPVAKGTEPGAICYKLKGLTQIGGTNSSLSNGDGSWLDCNRESRWKATFQQKFQSMQVPNFSRRIRMVNPGPRDRLAQAIN